MKEIRSKAKKLMEGCCRVCPICNGNACAGEVPGMGGLGTGASFKANIDALAARRFNMRLLHDVAEPETAVRFFDYELNMPVLAAPIGGVSFNMGGGVSELDYISAVLEGTLEAGSMGCTGDGVPEELHKSAFRALAAVGGRGIPFIKPWEDKEMYDKLEQAVEAGARIVGMDVDAAGLITLKKMGRPVSPKPLDKMKEIIENVPAKFIIKGIMTPDEAKMAVDAGADAIVISNHGGRVLDHTPGAADVLPDIADAVKGDIVIMADGGVRSGGDVLKMLALGAEIVMIGRPVVIAAIGGLKDGVVKYFETIKTELMQSMVLTGTDSVRYVRRSIINGY